MNNGKIIIEPVNLKDMRYPTLDDFQRDKDGNLVIKVVDFVDSRYFALVALHAFVEAILCEHAGIPTSAIDEFDMRFEKDRKPGDESEPGDDSNSIYKKQHCAAMGFERMFAALLGVDWKKYEEVLSAYFDKPESEKKVPLLPPENCEAGGKANLL